MTTSNNNFENEKAAAINVDALKFMTTDSCIIIYLKIEIAPFQYSLMTSLLRERFNKKSFATLLISSFLSRFILPSDIATTLLHSPYRSLM